MSSLMSLATTDICDANTDLLTSGEVRPLPPIFHVYGRKKAFSGPVATVKCYEDNGLVIELLAQRGQGRVLVIDGCGSLRNALIGSVLAKWVENNGWAGIVAYGCIRDVEDINRCDIGVRALGSYPMKPSKKGTGEKHVPVTIAGTRICKGEWLYADNDGILIATSEITNAFPSAI